MLSWFHKAAREILRVAPKRLNPDIGERGVFGIRSYGRPNPIGLSLVRLLRVEGSLLHVSGLDAIGGTPVLDIKPYFEQDIVFSPSNPYFRPANPEIRREMFLKEAVSHHQEECLWLDIGVRVALIADEHFGKIQSPDLKVSVTGPGCLADVIQGLTRARFSNPPRFEYKVRTNTAEVLLSNALKALKVKLRHYPNEEEVIPIDDHDLFEVLEIQAPAPR